MTPDRIVATWATSIALASIVATAGCSNYAGNSTATLSTPTRDNFGLVSSVLEPHCGTLDCHGSPARNFRVYGEKGLRARGGDKTGTATSESDVDATYESIVSIDPEVLARIFEEGGHDPWRWIVISKARGREAHVGGVAFSEGSPGDRCLVSWAGGMLDPASCNADFFGPPRVDAGIEGGTTW
jgi:hypothetical protein